MRQFRTVFKFEYANYMKSKGYIAITAVLMAIIIIVTSIPAISGIVGNISEAVTGGNAEEKPSGGGAETDASKALIADQNDLYSDGILASYFPQYNWTRAADLSGAEEMIENGEYELAVSIDGLSFTLYENGSNLMMRGSSQGAVSAMIKDVYQTTSLMDKGFSDEETSSLLNASPIGEVYTVGKDQNQTYWLSYVVLMLMYMIILLYGQFVMTSTVTEKTTKAMELLVTSTKPFNLMFGKVMGVGAAGLTQFGLILVTALGFFRLNYNGWAETYPMVAGILDMSVSGSLIFYAVLFCLLGFFSFAFVYAGLGSTVSRMEDAQSTQILPMFLFIAAFMVAIFGSMTPEAGYVTVCSFIPFLSPLVMFMRICTTDVSTLEVVIAIAVNVATILGAAVLSSRIYKVGVMLYGKKPNLKDIIKYAIKA